MIYETDTDMVAVWNGSAWRYMAATTATSGNVLKVVQSNYATTVYTTSTSYVDSGLTASITPASTSNKVLVTFSIQAFVVAADTGVRFALQRNGTTIAEYGFPLYAGNSNTMAHTFATELDSPSSTSSVTYKIVGRCVYGASVALSMNYGDSNGQGRSTMTLMEIAG
jgi:hypothetical protein